MCHRVFHIDTQALILVVHYIIVQGQPCICFAGGKDRCSIRNHVDDLHLALINVIGVYEMLPVFLIVCADTDNDFFALQIFR